MDTRSSTTATPTVMEKKKKTNVRKLAATSLALAILVLVAWFLFTPSPIHTELATVTRGPMTVSIDNQGKIRAHDKYVIATPVAARLERIELREGDSVSEGQIVAILHPLPMDPRQKAEATAHLEASRALASEATLRTHRAFADLQLAINERHRTEQLVHGHFVSPQTLDKALAAEAASRAEWNASRSREMAAQADVRAAQAVLIASEATSEHRVILRAPVDGRVLNVQEKSERTVAAGTPLLVIDDPRRYEIVVDVLSTDAVKIHPGDAMLLEDWGGNQTLHARVRLVEPVAFTKISALGVEEQRVNIIADPIDPMGPLGDGYRIEARIVIWHSDQVIKVPGSSLFRVGDAWHLFKVENGRLQEHTVVLGQRNQEEAQVLSGIEPGAEIIRYPGNEMQNSMRVLPMR